jgi:hypothetical protein
MVKNQPNDQHPGGNESAFESVAPKWEQPSFQVGWKR